MTGPSRVGRRGPMTWRWGGRRWSRRHSGWGGRPGPAGCRGPGGALEPPPQRLGVTHRSSRLLAAELGVSNVKVAWVWREYRLQPWQAGDTRVSTLTPAWWPIQHPAPTYRA